MVERRKLTEDFVDNLEPPVKGERWIADTEIRGFGVRLWGGKTCGKSFAIRVNDKNGRTVRESLFPANSMWLDFARKEARNTIRELKGIEEPLALRERIQKKWTPRLKQMSFDRLAKLAVEIQRRSTKSEQYVDDNWSRYTAYASPVFGMKKAVDVTVEEIIVVLDSLAEKPAQRRNLRSFLSYMLNLAWNLSPDFREAAIGISRDRGEDFQVYRKEEYLYDGRYELKVSDFDQLFKILENEAVHIQKAHFIQLLFYFGPMVSPRKFMGARRDEFGITDIIKVPSWWDGQEEDRQYARWQPKFKYKKYAEYRIQDEQVDVLRKVAEYSKQNFPDSPFLFPSARSPKSGHMTSFMDYWNRIKDNTGLPNMSLRKLIGNYMWACNEGFKVYEPGTIRLDDN